jgi:hypothetical protein
VSDQRRRRNPRMECFLIRFQWFMVPL